MKRHEMSGNGNGFSYKFFEKMVVKEFYYIYNKYNIRLYLEVNVTVTLTKRTDQAVKREECAFGRFLFKRS